VWGRHHRPVPSANPPPLVAQAFATHSVLTRTELLNLGASDNDLRRWVRRGNLRRLRGGVYASTSDVQPDCEQGRELHGALRAGEDVVISHRSAAAVHGLDVWNYAGLPEVTRDPGRSRIPGVRVHRYGVESCDVVVKAGLRVTTPERTVVDVCRVAPEPAALVTADSALRRGLVSPDRVLDALQRLGDINFASRARQTIAWANGLSESPLESFSRGQLLLHDVPSPMLQWWVGDGVAVWFRPDKLWAQYGLIGEADGSSKYGARSDLINEKQRQEWFEDRDFVFVRWDLARIRSRPDEVAARWVQLQQRQRRNGWKWPSDVWLVDPGPWPGARGRIVNRAPTTLLMADRSISGI
jgi:hypothetical protein